MNFAPILEVAENVTGGPSWFDGERQYFATADVEGARLLQGVPVTFDERPSRANLVSEPGDVLFAKMQATEKVLHINGEAGDAIFSTGFFNLRPRKGRVHPRYLFWFLRSEQFQAEKNRLCTGATQKALTLSALENIVIPLPTTIREQEIIADHLDRADAIRSERQQSLALAGEFLRSVFLEMFGDPLDNPYGFSRERIGDRLSKTRAGTQSGPFGSALKKHEYTDYGVPVWGVENVHPNRFKGEARLFISNEKYEDLRRYNVVRGDVLISRAGTVGRMCVAGPVCAHSIISTNLVRVSLDRSKLLPEYFVCLFTYFADRLGALKANNKDDAFTFLNPKTLREIKIPIPEIARQQNFVRVTCKLDGLLARAQDQRDGLSDLFSSLSQRAFRGEL